MAAVLHEVLVGMGWFALAFGWGALNYCALMKTRDIAEEVFYYLAFVLCVIFFSFTSMHSHLLLAGVVLAQLCAFAAWFEYKVNTLREWKQYFGKLLLATFQSSIVGILGAIFVDMPGAIVFWANVTGGNFWVRIPMPMLAVIIGCTLTPCAISVFHWLFHTSKLRSGYDSTFHEAE